ncbi:MAG: 50S ribosomal protein L9 [Bacilli bacterium]|nr:50S ribosomal protein L9 [Bacilli bacterium]
MKVILLQDVKTVGKKGQIVEVSDGYAMNFLFPRKLGVKATDKSLELKQAEEVKVQQKQAEKKDEMLVLKQQLEAVSLVLYAKSGKDGKMFGSISTKQIAEALQTSHQLTIDKRKFLDNHPINTFGFTNLKIELWKDVVAQIKVEVKEQK